MISLSGRKSVANSKPLDTLKNLIVLGVEDGTKGDLEAFSTAVASPFLVRDVLYKGYIYLIHLSSSQSELAADISDSIDRNVSHPYYSF